ncbi:hypothetical protein B0H13DRAFT_2518548 [Mycena leptocephala]|nr:hypothetical protein B0H13DRAFT_2518548 [Mycena leptocephala]
MNPLSVQELLDHCVGFLHDSVSDLQFGNISSPYTWTKLKDTLNTSPHVIRHIQQHTILPDELSLDDFSALCNLPFTHLERVFIFNYPSLSASTAGSIQKLLSLPTVRRVGILCNFDDPARFLELWDGCSPSIKHLELYCDATWQPTPIVSPIAHHCPAPIVLESLRMTSVEGLGDWLTHELCPFDFSSLKVLSVHSNVDLLRWPIFRSALATITALDIKVCDMYVDLSALSALAILRISGFDERTWADSVVDTLSTIPPTNCIHTIIITTTQLNKTICAKLEHGICRLSLRRSTLEVEINTIIGDLHKIYRDPWTDNWFDTVSGDEGSMRATMFG